MFYGWRIVSLVFVSLFVSYTLNFGIGVYFQPVARAFSTPSAPFDPFPIVAAYLLVWGVMHLFVGTAVDRFGPKRVLAAGAFVMALGMLASGFATAPWHLYVTFSMVAGVGFAGCSPLANAAIVNRWFIRKRGRALGLALAGVNAGQVLGVLAIHELARGKDPESWRIAFWATGGALFVVAIASALVLVNTPAQRALLPDGDRSPMPIAGAGAGVAAASLGEVLGRRVFWYIAPAFFTCGFSMFFIFMNLPAWVALTVPDQAVSVTRTALVLLGAASFVGMLIAGRVSDRVGREGPLALWYLARAGAVVLALTARDAGDVYLFAVVFGLFSFATVPLTSAWLGDRFGPKVTGRALGVAWFIHQLGAGMGIIGAGLTKSRFGDYQVMFLACGGLLLAAAGLCALAHRERGARPLLGVSPGA